MRRSLAAVTLPWVALVVGCVSADVTLLTPNNRPLPSVPEGEVRVFLNAKDVPGPFQRVALLSTHGDAGLTNVGQMIETARKKAALLGANGIIVSAINEPSAGEALGAKFVSPMLSGDRRGSVLAIRFQLRDATSPAAFPQKEPINATPSVVQRSTNSGSGAPAGTASIKPGFRDLKWGDAPTSEMKPYTFKWTGAYSGLDSFERPGDELSIEGINIFDLVYGFRTGRLAAVRFRVDFSQQEAMLIVLSKAWGEPSHSTRNGIETWNWGSSSSTAVFGKDDSTKHAGVAIYDRNSTQLDKEENKPGL